MKIKTALISVYDKTGLFELAKGLSKLGVRIISTGRTAASLKEAGVACEEVSEITKFPEMLDGRVKTLHPLIHGGILARRDKKDHLATLKKHGIPQIDMVVVNLYPFADAVAAGKSHEDTIEMIDIGGPAMLRAAAKNFNAVAPVCDASDYPRILADLKTGSGTLSEGQRRVLALKAFRHTAAYDAMVSGYLERYASQNGSAPAEAHGKPGLPARASLEFQKVSDLRYGENPHQRAAVYRDGSFGGPSLVGAEILGGKELSFNNYLDMEYAWSLVSAIRETAACVIKHNNPCGAAVDKNLAAAFQKAFDCDPLSAFGGIVGLNRAVDLKTAKVILNAGFLECITAPDFSADAVQAFKAKKNLRIVRVPNKSQADAWDYKRITGGVLMQDPDEKDASKSDLKAVTKKKPAPKEIDDLLFAFKLCRFVKSNAIVLVKGMEAVGIGMGQPSRVDSAITAFRKAGKRSRGAVMASDGFFPKPDTIELAAKHGVRAIIQPGGSIQDEAIVQAADKAKIAMVTTGIRHFTH